MNTNKCPRPSDRYESPIIIANHVWAENGFAESNIQSQTINAWTEEDDSASISF